MPSIRPLALAVPRRGDDLLVFEGFDPAGGGPFHRPLDVRLLGVLENIFHAFGRDGHEIVFVFGCRLADPSVYERDVVGEILDDPGTRVLWRPLTGFGPGRPLHPDGLTALFAEQRRPPFP